jgi:hypothetical protein
MSVSLRGDAWRRPRLPLATALWVITGLAMLTTVSAQSTSPVTGSSTDTLFLEALRAAHAPAGRGGSIDMFTPLIGDWDAEVVDHLPGGISRRQSAEVHFAWVLEGRAIQDLWIAPARQDRLTSAPRAADGNRYGTTLRIYDPELDAWRLTWWNPVARVETRLVGRRVGSQIVQTGADAAGRLIRWVFVELRNDRFHWRGEYSEDGGLTWICATEYFARRRLPPPEPAAAANTESRVAWAWTDRPGLETLRLVRNAAGTRAEGSVLVVLDGAPTSARYTVEHDAAWRFRQARIETDRSGARRAVDIRRDERGRWTIDGMARPDLDGCDDVDLTVTPYTNTPALASQPLAPGTSRRLRVAWVLVPSLDVRTVDQEYTRLDSSGPDVSIARYRYHNLDSGFTGELTLGADGLVVDYGPWARR